MIAVEVGNTGDGFTEIINANILKKNSKNRSTKELILLMAMKNKEEE